MQPSFRTPLLRPYRAAMYTCLGLTAFLFAVHGLMIHGFDTQKQRMSIDWMIITSTLNTFGAVAYATRVCTDYVSLSSVNAVPDP